MPSNRIKQEAISINFRHLGFRLLRNWYWFAVAVAVALGLAYVYLRYEAPLYQSWGAILIEEDASSSGISEQLIANQLGFASNPKIENEIFILGSRRLMEKVVERLGLDLSLTYTGQVRDIDHYPFTDYRFTPVDSLNYLDSIGVEYGQVNLLLNGNQQHYLVAASGDTTDFKFGEPFRIGNRYFSLEPTPGHEERETPTEIRLSAQPVTAVAAGLAGRLSIQSEGESNVVSLSLVDPIPLRARHIINTLISVYDDQIVTNRSLTGNQTLEFLDERIAYVTEELYAVEASVANLKQREGLVVDVSARGADYLDQLNEADAQLAELEVRKDLLLDVRETLNQGDGVYKPVTVASEVVDGALSGLTQRYNNLIFERDNRLEVATADNPIVVTFDERLRNLKSSIERGLETALQETDQRIRRVRGRIRPLENSMNRIPQNERRVLQVMRQQQIKNDLFVFLIEKREEAALGVAAQVPNTRIIDEAVTLPYPVSPKPTQTYLLAFALGLFIPGAVILTREVLDNGIRTEDEIENRVDVPIMGRVAKSSTKDKIVITEDNRSGVAEMFRLLRTNVNFVLNEIDSPVILITSGVSGDGKTFIASNLASSLGLGNKRVVLITTDLRRPKLSALFHEAAKAHKHPGISNYLTGGATLEKIIQTTSNPNLDFIGGGPIPPNPSELLLKPATKELIGRLRDTYDVVVIDSAPIGLVTDALLLKQYVDITLYVVALGTTPRWSLQILEDTVDRGKLPNVAVVVNRIEPTRDYGYGYAHGYFK